MQEFIDADYDESVLTEKEKAALKNLSYSLTNKPKPVYIKIEKHSTDTNVLLNNAIYKIFKKTKDESGKDKLEEYTTLVTGACAEDPTELEQREALGKVGCELEYGTYVIRETDAPYGYLLTEEDTGIDSKDENFEYQEIEFTIDEEHVTTDKDGNIVYMASTDDKDNGTTFVFKDKPIMGTIKINKVGSVITDFVNSDVGFESETQGLEGATFGLYAAEDIRDDAGTLIHAKDALIDTKVSDSKGYITFTRTDTYTGKKTDQFFMGNYYVKELSAPEGYVIDKERYDIVLNCDGTASKINDLTENLGEMDDEQGIASSHGSYFLTIGPTLNPLIQDATKIIFTHVTAPKDVEQTDVSADGDGTIMMWKDGTTYYISSQKTDQVIYFNINCCEMFKNCTALTDIIFNNIDTSYMVYATEMFMNDRALTQLDLSNFTTGRLTNTVSMFQGSNILKTIYVGNETQNSPDEEEATIVEMRAYPASSRYFYFNPNEEGITEDAKDINKFQAEDFIFAYLYTDSTLDEIDVTDDDIKSITPAYPYFEDGTTKSGELEVTIVIKADSQYALNNEDTELKVKVNVVDPSTLDFSPITEEHPEASVVSNNTQKLISAVVRKVSEKDPDTTLSGAVFTITAETDLVNKSGDVLVKKGETVATINSLDNETGDGGDACAPNLPTGLYAKDKDAKYLYKITETTAPVGYETTDEVAYIPNIDLTKSPSKETLENLASSADNIAVSFIPDDTESYGTYEFEFTFANEPCPTIAKNWGDILEEERPDSLTINVYSDSAKTKKIKTFTLTAENNWIAEWKDMPSDDISDYYFEEVVPAGVNWAEDKDLFIIYPASHKKYPNSVWFYNNFVGEYTSANVTKVWDDNDDYDKIRPKSVIVNLLCNGVEVEEYSNIKLTSANNWSYQTPKNLPFYDEHGERCVYTWEEDTSEGSPNLSFLTGNENTGYASTVETTGTETIITNTHWNSTEAEVEKVWNDNNDHFQVRPESVTVSLYADGEKVNNFLLETTNAATGKTETKEITDGTVVLTSETSWKAKAIEILKTNSDGTDIQYEWKEDAVPKYYTSESDTEILGKDTDVPYFSTTIKNTCTVEYGKVRVEKRIDKLVYDTMKEKPTFSFTLTGTDMFGKEFSDTKEISFSNSDDVIVNNKEGYVSASTSFTDLELGTYFLTEDNSDVFIWDDVTDIENGTPEKDSDNNPVVVFKINADNSSGSMTASFKNLPNQGKLKIVKYDDDGQTPLEGVTFALKSKDDTDAEARTFTTDVNGEIIFDEVPCGNYTITEIETVKGHSLLTEPIDVTLPLAMSKDEITQKNADSSNALYSVKTDKYNFYSLTYDVTNHANLSMPHTGILENLAQYITLIVGCGLILFAIIYYKKKIKK